MSDRYQEIRGILEDLVNAWPSDDHAALTRARDHLQTHCERCGCALVGKARTAGTRRCELCAAPPKTVTVAPASVPKRREANTTTSPAPAWAAQPPKAAPPEALQRWPPALHVRLLRFWHQPNVQQLIADMEALGVEIPVLRWPHHATIKATRDALLARPDVLAAVIRASDAGVSVRFLATLLFASPPGATSDIISKAVRPGGVPPPATQPEDAM
jgi:hypothetical protein